MESIKLVSGDTRPPPPPRLSSTEVPTVISGLSPQIFDYWSLQFTGWHSHLDTFFGTPWLLLRNYKFRLLLP